MKKIIDKSLILNRFKKAKNFKTDTELANFLEIKSSTLSNWYTRNSIDFDILFTKCENISIEWLLNGNGDMLKKQKTNTAILTNVKEHKGIPLIPTIAMAGAFLGENQILEYECERFIIPTFKDAEFLISIKGGSMYPKYSSGDIVACKRMSIDTFFQWNKVYVLDTEQGALIKRVKKGKNEDTVLICSDNPSYDPFELHRSKIYNIALVIGVIRLE